MATPLLTEQNVKKCEPVKLFSPSNPAPKDTLYLSNIDQTVAFYVETVFFYEVPEVLRAAACDIIRRVRRAVSEVLLVSYYFMAGRLRFNLLSSRLELVCNNKGVLFAGATASLRLKELGNLSFPNPSFQHLILPAEKSRDLFDSPILSIQVSGVVLNSRGQSILFLGKKHMIVCFTTRTVMHTITLLWICLDFLENSHDHCFLLAR